MKKFFLLLIVALLTVSGFAQIEVWPSNAISIGSTTSPGTNTINFVTNGTEAMRINSSGKLGVGTTSPSEVLDVAGNINIGSSKVFKIGGGSILSVTGTANVFTGLGAGASNTGIGNSFVGYYAGNVNTSSNYNSAFGYYSLPANSTGTGYNSAFGFQSMEANTTGSYNCAFGGNALTANTTATSNVGMGWDVLVATTSGSGNTGIGHSAGATNTTGANNTFLGYNADAGSGALSNVTAIGNAAVVSTTNTMFMGNSSVTHVYSTAGSFTTSDGRFKTNIKENVAGLAFIKKLRPVTYNLDTKQLDDYLIQNMSDSAKTLHKTGLDFTASTAMVRSGFIAQEVQQAAQDVGFVSSIVSTPNTNIEVYALSYEELVVPLVKGMQEQQTIIDSVKKVSTKHDSINKILQNQINTQDSTILSLQSQINRIANTCCPNTSHQMQNNGTNGNSVNPNIPAVGNSNVILTDAVVLNQNVPNPFAEQTIITYNIPVINNSAQILFYNTSGTLIKTVNIKTAGAGQLTVFANDLSNGTYSYTLVVDGAIIDTKRMVKQQ
ncbi:MAG TPA: tail fiber domain-containing protein [Bacteroidia bacterium]|nr:tail fiber domain-containing protein [Bacteroidia bacterium]